LAFFFLFPGKDFRAKTIFEKYLQNVASVTFDETTDSYLPTSIYGCNGCGEKFGDYRIYKEHVVAKHKIPIPKRYVCEICQEDFEHGNLLKKHKSVKHAGKFFVINKILKKEHMFIIYVNMRTRLMGFDLADHVSIKM
jgi:hypothetical protein